MCTAKPAEQLTPDYRCSSLPISLHARAEELFDHCKLIDAVISEINSGRYELNAGIRYRAQEKVLQSHHEEWSAYWQHHEIGLTSKHDYFGKHPLLVRLHHHEKSACTDVATQKQYWINKDTQKNCWIPSSAPPSLLPLQGTSIPTSFDVFSPAWANLSNTGSIKISPSEKDAQIHQRDATMLFSNSADAYVFKRPFRAPEDKRLSENVQQANEGAVKTHKDVDTTSAAWNGTQRPGLSSTNRISKARKGRRTHVCGLPGCEKVAFGLAHMSREKIQLIFTQAFTRGEHRRRVSSVAVLLGRAILMVTIEGMN